MVGWVGWVGEELGGGSDLAQPDIPKTITFSEKVYF